MPDSDEAILFQNIKMTREEHDAIMAFSMKFHEMEIEKHELSTGIDKFWEQVTFMLETAIIVEDGDIERLEE